VNAKEITQSTLKRALNDPMFLLTMTAYEITPEDIEDKVKKIIEYLDKNE